MAYSVDAAADVDEKILTEKLDRQVRERDKIASYRPAHLGNVLFR